MLRTAAPGSVVRGRSLASIVGPDGRSCPSGTRRTDRFWDGGEESSCNESAFRFVFMDSIPTVCRPCPACNDPREKPADYFALIGVCGPPAPIEPRFVRAVQPQDQGPLLLAGPEVDVDQSCPERHDPSSEPDAGCALLPWRHGADTYDPQRKPGNRCWQQRYQWLI